MIKINNNNSTHISKFNNIHYFLALNHISNIGPKTTQLLIKHWPNLEECFKAPIKNLLNVGLSIKVARAIQTFAFEKIFDDIKFMQKENHHILTWEDPHYPALLREIHDPPVVLYAIGDLTCLNLPCLAIVGTRHPTSDGKNIAYEWSRALSIANICIVSGLALGIDTYAHLGCLDANQPTIAVLGSGLNNIYPEANREIASKITQKGLILSEFPLFTSPKAGHFPRRNRIISGLTKATLVIEAAMKSGSLITARLALEQNRDVYALPGSIHLPQSSGCHHLLKQGASLVTCYQDVLLELGLSDQPCSKLASSNINNNNNTVLNCINKKPISLDTILNTTRLEFNEVIQCLVELEIDGKINTVLGGYTRCD